MKKLFANKELKNAIRRAMNKTQRRALEDGEIFTIRIHRFGKTLRRWGDDENYDMRNTAIIKIRGRNCEILDTSLKRRAWSNDPESAFEEAVDALAYYTYGERDEYKILIGGEPGKKCRPKEYWVEYIEYYGENNKYFHSAYKVFRNWREANNFVKMGGAKFVKR